MVSGKKKILFDILLIAFVVILSGFILAVSLIRTSLNIVLQPDSENKLRTEPVEFLMPNDQGVMEKASYKLPSASTLSVDYFYPLKKIRENLWIQFINNPIDKSRISLLIGDKRMFESEILIKKNKNEMALETIQEAIDKLKYAKKIIKASNNNKNIRIDQLNAQIFKAGFAYKKILENDKQIFEKNKTDNEKYQRLVNSIDKWNQLQEKERQTKKS
jgi:hypothetical protein